MSADEEADDDTSFRVLRALEQGPGLSQRLIAAQTQVSLGAVNYCLRALQDKGLIKVRNFRASDNKLRYVYVLTPSGLAAKTRLTRRFLERKLAEYAALREEIEAMRRDLDASVATDNADWPATELPQGDRAASPSVPSSGA